MKTALAGKGAETRGNMSKTMKGRKTLVRVSGLSLLRAVNLSKKL
jgi:hypothetical protein